ncbi:phenylalanyl-tRNA synthetase, beta subunit [Thermoplasmatales archaeon BRNA1]|nr:phenylalanyl-tRNA synthetase, beta subunit [Thermoplasmatales archaeon BRNA1]
MTNVNISYKDLKGLLGADVSQQTILERIPLLGSDIGDNVPGTDEMTIEFFPNRPDLYSVEGIARAMRQFLDIAPGLRKYDVKPSGIKATVTSDVRDVRPYFMCCAVYGVEVTDTVLRSMMELQEKLHITVGRKRAKLAIGIHDLDKVTPPFTFKTVDPDGISFVPLAKTEPMTPREILEKHEKGRAYAHLLEGKEKYPIIVDAEGKVLSFPPIINGALTTVTTETRNLLIDVTGFDATAVEGALNIVATALAERGGTIMSVEMEGAPKKVYPVLKARNITVSIKECSRYLGTALSSEQCIRALGRMGMNARTAGDKLTACIPAYRLDMMHPVDIYEDIAIGYGFENIGNRPYRVTQTFGKLLPETEFTMNAQDIMVGLGYTEITTLTLSNRRDEFELSGFPEVDSVTVTNPITEEHTCLRSYLMPSLMRILCNNKHRDLPQKIFEVGYVIRNNKNVPHLCALQAASRSSFTEVKSLAESILREFNVEYTLSACDYPTFVPGRGAFIEVDGKKIGLFGEMSPRTITGYEMTHPVMLVEMDLQPIIAKKSGRMV